jgi:transcriptional regulator with GAF, ATPase, and Fis domain
MELPPLRNRADDIPLLAQHFLQRFARKLGRPALKLTHANVQELQRYNWPGNIRELQHVLERASIVSDNGRLRFDLPVESPKKAIVRAEAATAPQILTITELRQLEADNIRTALAAANGKISGPHGAAARLAMKPTTLASRIKALGPLLNSE